jgi:hypothetical protein
MPSRIYRDFCVEQTQGDLSLGILQLFRQHNHLTIGNERLNFNGESLVDESTVKPFLNGTCTEQWKILQSRQSRVRNDNNHF